MRPKENKWFIFQVRSFSSSHPKELHERNLQNHKKRYLVNATFKGVSF